MKKLLAIICLLALAAWFAPISAQQVINGYRIFVAVTAPGTPASGTAAVYVDSTSKKLCNKDDAGVVTCTSGGSGNLINYQSQLSAVVGTGAMATLYTYTIPANTLAGGKCLEATVIYKHSTGSTSTSYQWAFTSNSITTSNAAGGGTGAGVANSTTTVCFDAASTVNYQTSVFNGSIGATAQSPAFTRATTGDSTASQSIAFQFNVASSDQVTPDSFTVKLLQP